jgi:hypothetical protein
LSKPGTSNLKGTFFGRDGRSYESPAKGPTPPNLKNYYTTFMQMDEAHSKDFLPPISL